MKYFIIVLFVFVQSVTIAQLNPINNLYFNQWYECPDNYYEMSWDVVVHPEDTLLGFNIYRNDELFRFQNENFLHHEEYGDSNCSEDFLSIECCEELWIHVTAVYNRDSSESAYIDSIYSPGLALNTDLINDHSITCYPNPATNYLVVEGGNESNILIFDIKGILQIKSKFGIINISKLKSGIYFVISESKTKSTLIKRIEIIK